MPETARDAEEARRQEYATYVATDTIYIDGARAFNVGDPVPASHVTRGVVNTEQVAKTSTKAGQAATTAAQEG